MSYANLTSNTHRIAAGVSSRLQQASTVRNASIVSHGGHPADAAYVVDRVTFRALYERIGVKCRGEVGAITYDTAAARDVGYRVVNELLRLKWNVEE
jgi:hypothetical protein